MTRSEIMSRIRSARTGPEETVARLLPTIGEPWFFRNVKELAGKPDFVLPLGRSAVFVNGCFWHGHGCRARLYPRTNRAFWMRKIRGNRRRDGRVAKALRRSGWAVLTVWECELRDEGKAARVLRAKLERSENSWPERDQRGQG